MTKSFFSSIVLSLLSVILISLPIHGQEAEVRALLADGSNAALHEAMTVLTRMESKPVKEELVLKFVRAMAREGEPEHCFFYTYDPSLPDRVHNEVRNEIVLGVAEHGDLDRAIQLAFGHRRNADRAILMARVGKVLKDTDASKRAYVWAYWFVGQVKGWYNQQDLWKQIEKIENNE